MGDGIGGNTKTSSNTPLSTSPALSSQSKITEVGNNLSMKKQAVEPREQQDAKLQNTNDASEHDVVAQVSLTNNNMMETNPVGLRRRNTQHRISADLKTPDAEQGKKFE